MNTRQKKKYIKQRTPTYASPIYYPSIKEKYREKVELQHILNFLQMNDKKVLMSLGLSYSILSTYPIICSKQFPETENMNILDYINNENN